MKYTGKYITFDVPESWADTVDFREEENSIAASYRGLPLVVFAFPENPESSPAAQGFEALGTLTDGTSTRTLMAEFPEVSNIMGCNDETCAPPSTFKISKPVIVKK